MKKLTLSQVFLKSEDLKTEIKNRLKTEIEEFEISKLPSGEIRISWFIVCEGKGDYIFIPENWRVFSIAWNLKKSQIYACPTDFYVFKPRKK